MRSPGPFLFFLSSLSNFSSFLFSFLGIGEGEGVETVSPPSDVLMCNTKNF